MALGFENLDLDQPIPEDWTWEDEDEDEQSDSAQQSMGAPVHEMATLSMTPNLSSAPPPGTYGYSSPSYPTSYGSTGYYGNTPSYPVPPQTAGYAHRYPPPPSNQYGYMHSTGLPQQPPYQQAPPPSNPAYQQAPPPSNPRYGGYPGQFPPPSHGGGHIGFNI